MEHIPHQPHKAAQQELFNNFAGNAPKRSMSWRHQSLKKPPARLRSWQVTPARPTMTAPLSCSHPRGRKRAMAHRGDTHRSPQPAPITRGGGGTKWRAGPGRAGERLRHVAPHRPSRPGGDGRGGRRKEPRGAAMGRKKKKKGPGAAASRLVVTFDEERRREYLTGFHKRKVERRKVALEEIKKKLKEEQRKMKEERHKEYLKMLSEREEALEEFDELEHLVTSRTESVNIDHPNHIVTVTTISDLDLSGARQLGLTTPEGKNDGSGEENGEEVVNKPARTVPKKSRNPLLSEKISALTATLHVHSRKKSKGKRPQRGQGPHQKIKKPAMRRTTKTQRRRLTGKMGRDQD